MKITSFKPNNRGQTTLILFLVIFVIFISVIFIFIGGFIVFNINSALDYDVDLGQVNLKDVNQNSFGQFNEAFVNNADFWGISVIFGGIFGLFISAYFLRSSYPKLGIILDIFIILSLFIVSLYLSSTYQTIIDSLASVDQTYLEDNMPKSSGFIINLPIYVVIIGVIAMVIFHSSLPKRKEEQYQQGGYLQGI